ncbi:MULTISPECIES: sensor domain-containing protein [Paraburkholderia]|uniref:Diguanylate cyclase n=1 Tax=Paraburkholderia caribensis TaxID=75105 RepID=A0A9Q6WKY1_9BURK|nr:MULTISPECIES: EAL domain-containing protein [Paraburkholderia]ALP63959.1 diguanylate cyclase [Paraburkholderia caribensis]AMV41487.1 diguanylate cyclase [Paraburkholderia caribensis]AUT50776.1 diguanylate cyclase [Paraburkholderia caribensis]MCO4875429.1 EAL domain-containing protein [Paraburkholderia caribensis]MDR6379916.1 diguanylate cyclase (GGDEF)-like protein/PAS domain S-box-containing protein [Paraburkholderia caribensis]
MISFLSKRLLINLAVVAAAVGANAFVAYTQICAQRDADARTVRSTAIRQNLEAYRATLEDGLGVLGRYEDSARPAPADAASAMSASLAKIDKALHEQLANQPNVAGALAQLTANGSRLEQDIALALAKTTAPEQDGSRAWAAQTYTRLGMEIDRLEARMDQLRAQEDLSLKAALDASMRDSRYAMLFLIVTMLAGSGLLIYTFGARENVAREKLRIAKALHRHDERFRGLFEQHPVPMYIFDRDTLRFLAVNSAAVQQYGYSESEFLSMTVRAIRPHAEVARLESHLQRSDVAPGGPRTMAGIWHHRRKDGSQISVDISYHAMTFMGRPALFVLADDVTEQINAEAEAQRSNQMLETVIDNIPQRIFWKDKELRYLGCNMAFARDAGLAYPEQVIGKRDEDMPWRAFADELGRQDTEVMASGVPKMNYETDMVIDGVHRTTVTSKLSFTDSDGRVIGVLGSYTDITERKRADLALRLQSRALDASVNAILITAPSKEGNLIEYVNPAFKRITGYDPQEVIGQDCRVLQRDDRDQEGIAAIRQALAANREVSAVLRNYRKDGVLFWNQLYIAPVPDANGQTTHHIAVINDVTALIRYQEQLEYQANYDSLTRLPNRNLLRDRLQHALIVAQRHHKGVAVVFIDLDGFKNVNDSLGHSVGDRLLSVVADRLARCARASDTVARHGGDEFVIVMKDTVDEQSLIAWMERVRASISEPVWLDGTELYVGCSMGASLFPQDGDDAETLMKKADLAMYRAKDMGRNTFQFYQPEMNVSAGARLNLERRLRRALRDNEFLLHYQPQVDIETGQVVGMEALVRWSDPEVGLIPPSQFIPVAEESGLIGPLSEWVLREACRQNKAWQDEGLPPARVSVNLSARQFQQRDIAKLVMQVLEETGLDPQYLELELTESTIMRNAEEAVSMLNELHALGIGLAIDDFGTGYSSLSYLKRFPVDRLKIDRSFVSDIGESSDDETITSAIIALAHSLNLQVIAEGVETSTQLDFLKERACDEMQGYFFAKPLPHEAIPGMLQRGAEKAAMIAANA